MDTLDRDDNAPQLPAAPSGLEENVVHDGRVTESSFDTLYGQYRHTRYYGNAKKVFLHPNLNRGLTTGVNTWHEQVLAGRLDLVDLRIMGYVRLARFREETTTLLTALTDGEVSMTPTQLRSAMIAAEESRMVGLNPPMRMVDVKVPNLSMRYAALLLSMYYVRLLGSFDLDGIRFYREIHDTAGAQIDRLALGNVERAWTLMRYVDDFISAFTATIHPGMVDTYHYVPGKYTGEDLLSLMDGGVTPVQAVGFLRREFPVDRALLAVGISTAVVEGMI